MTQTDSTKALNATSNNNLIKYKTINYIFNSKQG